MNKKMLSLLLKRNIRKIENKDLYDYLDNFSLVSSELSLNNKIQINSYEKTLIDVKDLKKMLNFLAKITGSCIFIVSKEHLFYSGSDNNSDFSTFKKLELYRNTLEKTTKNEIMTRVKGKKRIHDFNIIVEPTINKIQIDDSLLISIKSPQTSMYFGFLGSLNGDIDLLVAILKYLSESPTFNERLSRIFN